MKDLTGYLKQLRRVGYTTTLTGGLHWRVTKEGQYVGTCGSTPASWWGLDNLKGRVRKFEKQQR